MKKVDLLYYIAIFCTFCINLIITSRVVTLDASYRTMIYGLIVALFVIKIIFTKYSKKQLIFIVIFGVISLYTTYILDNYMFLINFLAIVGIKNIKMNTVVKIDIVLKMAFLFFNTIIYFIDYSNGIDMLAFTSNYKVRHYLYFSHPNTAAGVAVWLAIDMLYISKKKLRTYIFTTIMMVFYYALTISRTAIIVYAIFSVILLISEKKPKVFYQKTNFLLKYLIDIFAIVTIVLLILPNIASNTTFTSYIDNMLSGRLFYSQWALNVYGVNLLPNIATRVLEESLIVDNFYIRCLVSFGCITYIALSAKYKMVPKTIKNIDRTVLLILPFYLFNEVFCYSIGRAIPILLLANVILNQESKTKELAEDSGKEDMLVTQKLT